MEEQVACFCANIDYPAVGAWAACDQHFNDSVVRRTGTAERLDDTLVEDLLDALHSVATELRRSTRPAQPRTGEESTGERQTPNRPEDLKKKTAW